MEKNLGASGKCFDIGGMRRKHCNNALRKRTLSSYV
jgi:hypothetical protein